MRFRGSPAGVRGSIFIWTLPGSTAPWAAASRHGDRGGRPTRETPTTKRSPDPGCTHREPQSCRDLLPNTEYTVRQHARRRRSSSKSAVPACHAQVLGRGVHAQLQDVVVGDRCSERPSCRGRLVRQFIFGRNRVHPRVCVRNFNRTCFMVVSGPRRQDRQIG